MRRLLIALIIAAIATPAHADPVSIGAAVAGIASWWASIGVVGQAVVGLGIALAATGISYLLNGGKALNTAKNQNLPSVNVPERDGLLERTRLYGTDTTPGGVFIQRTTDNGVTDDKSIYVYGVAISDGECNALKAIIINGVECLLDVNGFPITFPWNSGGNTYFKASFRPGTETQAIDPIIAARFPTESVEFRQRGVCTVVMEMEFGDDADHHTELWGAGGIPQLLFQVEGLKIYDPRDGTQSVSDRTTWLWSDNATLVEADWLMCDIGFNMDPALIEWQSVRDSADVDDGTFETLNGEERLGRCNGRAFSSESNADVLENMALQNRALIRRADGVYTIRSRMVAEEPVSTIHQNLLVGDISYQNEPDTRAALNTVHVEFSPASRFNQSAETTYQDAALVILDGQELPQRISLRFCDSPAAAQRIGYSLVMENRAGRTLAMAVDIASLYAPGKANKTLEFKDVARIEMRNYDALNGTYSIEDFGVTTDFVVQLSLNGYDPTMISGWSVALETPFDEAA